MKELKSGNQIQVKDENLKKLLDSLNNSRNAIIATFDELSKLSQNYNKEIFKLIEENNPMLKQYNYNYNHATGIVTVLYKKDVN